MKVTTHAQMDEQGAHIKRKDEILSPTRNILDKAVFNLLPEGRWGWMFDMPGPCGTYSKDTLTDEPWTRVSIL